VNIVTSKQNTITQSEFQGAIESTSLTLGLQFPIKEQDYSNTQTSE